MEDIVPETELQEVKRSIDEEEQEQEEENQGGTGIITHFISSLVSPMSPKAGNSAPENGEDCCNGDLRRNLVTNLFRRGEEDDAKASEEESTGIIDNIVSHFPTSIPDDAVPTTDEASILINSIVKD